MRNFQCYGPEGIVETAIAGLLCKNVIKSINLCLRKNKLSKMEKIKTGLAAFGMSGQIFHAPADKVINPAFA